MLCYRQRRTVFALVFALTFSFAANAIDVMSLNKELKSKKKSWKAGETSVSVLADEDVKKMMGLILEEKEDISFSTKKPQGMFDCGEDSLLPDFLKAIMCDQPDDDKKDPALPPSIDWRNKDGKNYSTAILDQGHCGSCVAFAAVGALQTQLNITRGTEFSPWLFSPQHLFACGGGMCSRGWRLNDAATYLQSSGVPDETCFPYTSGVDGKDMACSASCSDSSSRSLKIDGFTTQASMFSKSINKLKSALQAGPVMVAMIVYEDFIYYKSGVYEHTTGAQLGGHAVTLEGYDDKDDAFIVRNSWGVDWGEKGYFRIKYNDKSNIGMDAVSFQVSKGDGVAVAKGLQNKAVLSGKAVLDLHSTYPDTTQISYEVNAPGSYSVAQGSVKTNSTTDFDTTTVPDGMYILSTSAETKKGTQKGQSRFINVLNGKLKGSLGFSNIADGDTVTGDKEIQLDVSTTPIYPTMITFFFKNLSTKEVVQRGTTNVGKGMEINWRTSQKPKGDYEIWLEGVAGTQTMKSDVLKVTVK